MLADSPGATTRDSTDGKIDDSRGRKFRERGVAEAKRFVIIFIYLWALFGLFVLHQRIVLHERGVGYTFHGVAVLNALVLAKVMLVFEDLDLGRWLPRRRLIYRISGESLLLTILFIVMHLGEQRVIEALRGEQISGAEAIGGGGIGGLLSVAAIVFVALMPFFAFKNVSRALGRGRLEAILIKIRPLSPDGSE